MSVYRRLVAWLFGPGSEAQPSVAIGEPATGLASPAPGTVLVCGMGSTVLRAQAVASAVNHLQVEPAAIAGAPRLSARGSDANIAMAIAAKGTGAVRLQTRGQTAFEVNATGTPANHLRVDGVAAAGMPRLMAQGSDTNISVQIAPKGTGFIDAAGPLRLPSYTVATLPSAATFARCLIYVSDGAASKRLAVSDGTNWRWPDGAVVS